MGSTWFTINGERHGVDFKQDGRICSMVVDYDEDFDNYYTVFEIFSNCDKNVTHQVNVRRISKK